jgi:hypothetical protein
VNEVKQVRISNVDIDISSTQALKSIINGELLARWLEERITNGQPVVGLQVLAMKGKVSLEVSYVVEET